MEGYSKSVPGRRRVSKVSHASQLVKLDGSNRTDAQKPGRGVCRTPGGSGGLARKAVSVGQLGSLPGVGIDVPSM